MPFQHCPDVMPGMQASVILAGAIGELLATPSLSLWALLAAMHQPDCVSPPDVRLDPGNGNPKPTQAGSARSALVGQLLGRLAPTLARSADAREFVVKRLGVDGRLLAHVLAAWAACSFDSHGEWPSQTMRKK